MAEAPVAAGYLGLLHRAGEAGPPLSEARMRALVADATGVAPVGERRGAMTYLTAGRPTAGTSG